MWVAFVVAESVLLIFGSLVGAILLCMLLWRLLCPLRHPEYGAIIIGALTIVSMAMPFSHSPFLHLLLLFSAICAVPLWIAGVQWRASERTKALHGQGLASFDIKAMRGNDRYR